MIRFPEIPNAAGLRRLAGAKAFFPGLVAVLVLSVWIATAWDDEPVPEPAPPIVVLEAVRPPPKPPPGQDVLRLREDLSALLNTPSLRNAEWSVLVVSLEKKDTLFARDEDRFLAPASNMKIATTAAALHFLGPAFRYQTFVFADGPIENGVLRGDLILYGTGDPGISDRFYRDRTDVFEAFASQVAEAGITRIEGAVVGDATYFSGPELGPEWDPRDLNEWFAASVSALSFNENIVTLQILPSARLGFPPRIETIPFGFPLDVSNQAETVAGRPRPNLWLDRVEPTAQIRVDGEIRQGGPDIWRRLTVPDPAVFAARAFREVLISNGIGVGAPERAVHVAAESKITGRESWAPGLIDGDEPRLLARHTSPELLQYLTVVNHESHNLLAETIIKTIGRIATGDGSFEGGARAVQSFATTEAGIDADQIRTVDGSGLSESNRTSAGALVGLLLHVAQSDNWDAFVSTLPEAGRRSLRRMYGTRAARNLRAKTGTIDGVSALTGIVTTRDGETLLFSILSNELRSTGAAKRVEDRIGARLADFVRIEVPTS
ncbi:MAG: D-alanyl-D-alanine carboxypeptidase/D-alanyl-D-alanine-endopeptidase [Gemmatimonadetes bacterium]|nr:D-alanyl-D-alanine carboxypeptidase/D-alanyl-D-alanine-endopeptidase [Gemmatimonadota bacterium]